MSRLDAWMADEIDAYEQHAGPLSPDERERFEAHLRNSLHGSQLRVADGCGLLGDAMLAALQSHSDGLRNSALARWWSGKS